MEDTGIGVPQEKQGKIFEPFSQADGSMTRKYGGTGLGLSISSRFVTAMGGTMRVESQLERGSTSHFTLRLAVSEAVLSHANIKSTREHRKPQGSQQTG